MEPARHQELPHKILFPFNEKNKTFIEEKNVKYFNRDYEKNTSVRSHVVEVLGGDGTEIAVGVPVARVVQEWFMHHDPLAFANLAGLGLVDPDLWESSDLQHVGQLADCGVL